MPVAFKPGSGHGMGTLNECYRFQGAQGMDNKPSNLTFRLQNGDSEVGYWNPNGVGRIVVKVYPTEDGSLTALSKALGGLHPITGAPLEEPAYHISLGVVEDAVASHFGRAVEGSNARCASLKVEEVLVDGVIQEYKVIAIDDKNLPEPLSIIPRIQIVLGQTYPHLGFLTVDPRKDIARIFNGANGDTFFVTSQ